MCLLKKYLYWSIKKYLLKCSFKGGPLGPLRHLRCRHFLKVPKSGRL